MSRRLVLLRHGRTTWNAIHRVQGQAESELDDLGHEQGAAAAGVLARLEPAVLWSSDSRRAQQTAAYLAAATGLPVRTDPRLREYFLGERQGLTHAEYAAAAPEEFDHFRRGNFDVVPGGEDAADVVARMSAALGELLELIPDGGVGVAVSHGAAIRDAVPALVGWPTEERTVLRGLDNCGWVVLDALEPGPLRLTAYNRVVTG